jgi:hypothetical protein
LENTTAGTSTFWGFGKTFDVLCCQFMRFGTDIGNRRDCCQHILNYRKEPYLLNGDVKLEEKALLLIETGTTV